MKYFIGTSGWLYDWNPDGFEWYVRYSGLNAVELNASFYRFPHPNQVKSWANKTNVKEIRWSVKVHRAITHIHVLNNKAIALFSRFIKLFEPLEKFIDFYLLQLPPRVKPTERMISRIEDFVREFSLDWKLAIEWRNSSWFRKEWVEWARTLKLTVVSVDSPEFIFYARSGPYTYIRLHGRTFWYSHYYTDDELLDIAKKALTLGGEKTYVFFNNDHDMLENARRMIALLKTLRLKSP